MTHRRVRKGVDLLSLRWDPAEKAYELCPSCGARRTLEHTLLAA